MNKYIKTAQSTEDPREPSLSQCGCRGSGYGRKEKKDSGDAVVPEEGSKVLEPQEEAKGKHACAGWACKEGLNRHPGLWVLS